MARLRRLRGTRRDRRPPLGHGRRPPGAHRRPAGALAAALVLIAAGCGAEDPTQQVKRTLTRLGRAAAAKDYRTLCVSVLDPALVTQVERLGLSCEQALAKGLGGVVAPELVVRSVQVTGSTARASVHTGAANQASGDFTVKLVKVKGSWRVSSLLNPR